MKQYLYIYVIDNAVHLPVDNIDKTNSDLEQIVDLSKKYDIKLFLGGPSFENINQSLLKILFYLLSIEVLQISKIK